MDITLCSPFHYLLESHPEIAWWAFVRLSFTELSYWERNAAGPTGVFARGSFCLDQLGSSPSTWWLIACRSQKLRLIRNHEIRSLSTCNIPKEFRKLVFPPKENFAYTHLLLLRRKV